MQVPISSIKIGKTRRAVDAAKAAELAESIREIGLLNPITILADNTLVAGAHRVEAYRILGRTDIEAHVVSLTGLRAELAEIDENLIRNEMHYTQRGDQYLRRKQIYEELYPQSRHGGDRKSENIKTTTCRFDPVAFTEDTAQKTGVSRRTVERELQIAQNLRPEVKQIVREADISKTTALKLARLEPGQQVEVARIIQQKEVGFDRALKDTKIQEKRERILTAPPRQPNGLFSVILADPPWRHEFSESPFREIENQYPTMSLEEIKAIEVPSDTDAVLFLWATAPKVKEALEVMEAWGFVYRTCAVWDKKRIGMGYWFRGQHELLLFGIKGKPAAPLPENRVSSVYREARGRHSQKPEHYYSLIEQMFPGQTYLELFARQKYSDKWAVWGNQV